MAPIPITIVTGFLGSGKTTLILNLVPQLRAANPNYRLALLKNEFGDLAVDSQLASSNAVSGVQELLNGCICCNLVGQLGAALDELRATQNPDRIVVETSGSAFPATLALEVNRLARSQGPDSYVLDGVVSVIDVENWKGYEDTSYTAKLQARYTDLVVFNKWEAVDERRFDDCLDRLGDLELEIPWVRSNKGSVPINVLFGVDGGLARNLTEEDVDGKTGHGDHAHVDAGHHEHAHDHQSEVEVLSVSLAGNDGGAIDAERLMGLLKTAPKEEVYRIKALLDVSPTSSSAVKNSDDDIPVLSPSEDDQQGQQQQQQKVRYILNWAFGRWTFTPLSASSAAQEEHASSAGVPLRMTLILARYESAKWKRKLEEAGWLRLQGGESGQLAVKKIL